MRVCRPHNTGGKVFQRCELAAMPIFNIVWIFVAYMAKYNRICTEYSDKYAFYYFYGVFLKSLIEVEKSSPYFYINTFR